MQASASIHPPRKPHWFVIFLCLCALVATGIMLLPLPLWSQSRIEKLNGQFVQEPEYPVVNMRVAGTTPGQCLLIDAGGHVAGSTACGSTTAFPSTPGIVFNTSSSAARGATYGDVVNLWSVGCTGILRSTGVCSPVSSAEIASALGYTPQPLASQVPNPIFRYDMLHVTASGITDSSPNGNNCTWSSGTVPASDTTGITLTGAEGCTLPAGPDYTHARTWVFAFYGIPIIGTTQSPNTIYSLVQNTTGWDWNLMGYNVMAYGPAGGGPNSITSCNFRAVGYNVIVYVRGTSSSDLDHIYINGQECPAYIAHAGDDTSPMATQPTLFNLPGGLWSGEGLAGNAYYAELFAGGLTAAQAASETILVNGLIAARGVTLGPVAKLLNSPHMICPGDSIDAGFQTSNPPTTSWCNVAFSQATNSLSYTLDNWGISGIDFGTTYWSAPYREGEECMTLGGRSTVLQKIGSNDVYNGVAPATILQQLAGYVLRQHQMGCRVIVGTLISRTGSLDTPIEQYNTLLRQNWKTTVGADGFIDFGEIPCLGEAGAYAGACFASGGVHPNDSGSAKMGTAAANVLNYLDGYSDSNPHVLSAGAYTMLASDGTVEVPSSVTAAVTLTLPSCDGMSGSRFHIANLQSTYAVTVVGSVAAQPIYGSTSAVTVPANGSLTLTVVPVPTPSSGCHWE